MSCLALFAASLWAMTDALSARSRLMLAQCVGSNQRLNISTVHSYKAFIAVRDAGAIDSLCLMGVKVLGEFNGFIMAEIPADLLNDVASARAVRHVSLAQPLHLCNDSSRYCSNVAPVQHGDGYPSPLLGDGVIIGIIDSGIDFNHINFMDENGRTRICAVYMPEDSTGTSPFVNGHLLPGSCYETPAQIAALTTDCENSSHGTHTTGTAAGSYSANHLQGVAPHCDIVACGIPEDSLTDVNVASAVSYIMDYAERVGKPCVINMSIGSNDGPNDGTSFMCRVFEAVSGPGRVCVVSAGNDGNEPVCFHSTLAGPADTVMTLLRNRWGGMQRNGYVSMWSDGSQVHHTRVVVINRQTGSLEYASPLVDILPDDSVFTLSSENDPAFARYYIGEITFASALENVSEQSDGRFHSYWAFDVTSVEAGHLLGLQYVADVPTSLSGWCTRNAYFYTFGLEGITGGTTAGSISDLATTDSVISVGAYCSRRSFIDCEGREHSIAGTPGEIASFSSYGPDEKGQARPDVCAPGFIVVSSGNRYNQEMTDLSVMTEPVVVKDETYPYYVNQGTSMSAPVVTGAIALMLQMNPSLGPADVREVLSRTSLRDGFVDNGDSSRWGFGKMDVSAAVNDVIRNTLRSGDVNNDGEVNIADITAVIDLILNPLAAADVAKLIRADVNRDAEIQVADINAVIRIILNN